MSKKSLLLALALLFGLPFFAEDFEVRIVSYPHEIIRGAPVIVMAEVCNISGHPVTVADGYQGFSISAEVTGSDGRPRSCPLREYAKVAQGIYQARVLPVAWRETRTFDITCATNIPSEYTVCVIVTSTPPYFQREHDGTVKEELKAWGGAVKSQAVHIQINEPTGINGEVYEKTKGQPFAHLPELFSKFPSSTYTAYALLGRIPDYSNPLFRAVSASEQVRLIRDEGKRVVAFPQEDFERYFQDMDSCLRTGNAPPNLRARLYGFYGDLLVQRGRFQEAEAAFKLALTDPSEDPESVVYKTRSQEFLRALSAESGEQWPKVSSAK